MTPKPAPNGALVYRLLSAHPYPVASDLRLNVQGVCRFILDGADWCFDDQWYIGDETIAHHLPAAEYVTADLLHAEIGRVRADQPADDPYIPTLAELAAEPPLEDVLYDRAAAEQALAKVTAERDDIDRRLSALKRDRHEETLRWADEREALRAEVKRLVDAHAVVRQRLVGSQKEVAEVSAERDAATARADKIEDRLRRDDDLRAQIAAAVGLDGSASLALILDTVTRDRPGREISRLSGLLDVLAAPVIFGERRLTTVERAEWALRRALRERDECAPRMAQLIEAEVLLDALGVPAHAAVPGDAPGDASEALTVAERLRLHFAAR